MSENIMATFVVVLILMVFVITCWRVLLVVLMSVIIAVVVSGMVYVLSVVQPS